MSQSLWFYLCPFSFYYQPWPAHMVSVVLGTEPGASHMPEKHCTTKLQAILPTEANPSLILDFCLQDSKSRTHHTDASHLSQTFCQIPNCDFVFVPDFGEVDVAAMMGHRSEARAVQKRIRRPWLLSGPEIPDFYRRRLRGSGHHQSPSQDQQAHRGSHAFQDVQQDALF